jgi:hypothetical protein
VLITAIQEDIGHTLGYRQLKPLALAGIDPGRPSSLRLETKVVRRDAGKLHEGVVRRVSRLWPSIFVFDNSFGLKTVKRTFAFACPK